MVNNNLFELINAYYKEHIAIYTDKTATVHDYALKIYSGGTPTTSQSSYWNGDLGWLSSGETRDRFITSTDKTITQDGVDNSSTRLAQKFDIVMASAGQGHTRGQTSMLLLDTYVNQSIIVIHADRLNLPFLFWNLANRYEELRAISDSNSIRGSLTTKVIASFAVSKVEETIIKSFADFAWAIIPKIESNLRENDRLVNLRDALLPRLLSGELDVSEVDI